MNKKELLILSALILIFVSINVTNYLKREKLKRSFAVLIEEGQVQISISSAEPEEFEDLPGIGPVMANRIVEYRNRTGGFKTLEELKKVKGIGEKLYQKILPYIKL